MKQKKKIYLESTIPSYLTSRPSRDLVVAGHQQITEDWWTSRRNNFDLFISQFVIDEISLGDRVASERRLELLEGIPELIINDDIQVLTDRLISSHAIPKKAPRDAAHIAVATVHSMDYLLTWNCCHLANAEVIPIVRKVCLSCGFECPYICTPEELMGIY